MTIYQAYLFSCTHFLWFFFFVCFSLGFFLMSCFFFLREPITTKILVVYHSLCMYVLPTVQTLFCGTSQASVSKSEKELPCPFCWKLFSLRRSVAQIREGYGPVDQCDPSECWSTKSQSFFLPCGSLESILLGAEAILCAKSCNSASIWVPAGGCVFCVSLLQNCSWVTHLSNSLVKAT